VYCEFASTFNSNDSQRGFDQANTFSSRTAKPIRLDEFRAKGCRLVALYTDDMQPGIASASKRLRPLKKLARITTDVSTGIVTWPNEVVVCVEILAEKATPDEAMTEIRKWQLVSTKAGATRREGLVLIPDEGKLVTFGTVDKIYANYRNASWFKVKEQNIAENVVVEDFNKKTNSALVNVQNTRNYAAGSWKMWSVPLSYVDKGTIINTLAKAAFDNDDTSDGDDDAVRPTYLARGCAIRWYVGHVAVRFFIIFSLKKIAGKAHIPLPMPQMPQLAGRRFSPPPLEIQDAGSADEVLLGEARAGKRLPSSAPERLWKRLPPPPPPKIEYAGSAGKVLLADARADIPLHMKHSTSVDAQVDADIDEAVTVKGICPVCKNRVYSNCCRTIINGAYHHARCGHSSKTFFVNVGCACGTCPVREPNVDGGCIVID
jgi:hypothetical protein